jgi:hypothetical protein
LEENMAKVFFSFYFDEDCWRTQQVRNIGAIEQDEPVSKNDWEKVKDGGDDEVEKWIEKQMKKCDCLVVLVGENTDSRPWIRHEIKRAWALNKGVLGIRIHKLEDNDGNQSTAGTNPFTRFTVDGKCLDTLVELKNPAGQTGKAVYATISENIETWVNSAINARK